MVARSTLSELSLKDLKKYIKNRPFQIAAAKMKLIFFFHWKEFSTSVLKNRGKLSANNPILWEKATCQWTERDRSGPIQREK